MNRSVLSFIALLLITSTFAEEPVVKSPVLLLCQHKESSSSWSLSMTTNPKDPSKPIGLVLEELVGKNSKDHKYSGVLKAHFDPASNRKQTATISASEFGKTKLGISENNLLSVDVIQTEEGLRLDVTARISADGYFKIGDQPGSHGVVNLKYNPTTKTWNVVSKQIVGLDGTIQENTIIKSIVFLSGSTRVSLIIAVDSRGKYVKLLDE